MKKQHILASVLLTASLQPAIAHRAWLLPSSTVLSGEKQWLTVDAAVSNNIFFFNHHAPALEQIRVTAPDGKNLSLKNGRVGEIRTTFDVELTQQGTYRLDSGREGFMAIWMEGEKRQRWFGTAEEFKTQKIKDKPSVRLSHNASPVVTFVTLGEPSTKVLEPTGKNLELIFDKTHPNDLFAGEEASFTVHLNGQPAAGFEVSIVKDQERYRNEAGEEKITVENDGTFTFTWPEAGRYWLQVAPKRETREEGKNSPKTETKTDPAQNLDGVPYQKRVSYTLTLEVLPE